MLLPAAIEVRELLDLAYEHDDAARCARRAAGQRLAELRDQTCGPEWTQALDQLGLDRSTARLLFELAAGGREKSA